MKSILDSRQLLAFTMLARRGSFTLAAKDLFLTQSAVSHAIKALEEEVGTRLFDRTGKRARLTQTGEQFLRHAEKILQEMELARAGLEHMSNWGHSRLHVGASTTACQHILPTVLREFRQHKVPLRMEVEMPTIETIRKLVQEGLGVAFLPRITRWPSPFMSHAKPTRGPQLFVSVFGSTPYGEPMAFRVW